MWSIQYWITRATPGTSASLYIKMNVCLFVCLFDRYAFVHSTCQCSQTFQESSFHPGEGSGLLFSENFKSFPPPKRPPSVSNQWNCSTPFSNRRQVTAGFRGCWVRICGPFGWNPIGWLRTNRNSVFEKFLNLNWIVVETVLGGFSKAASSNLMFIRLEIVVVKLKAISDKSFNPFRPAIRKIPYLPRRKCCNLAISGRKGLNSLLGSKGCGTALSPSK